MSQSEKNVSSVRAVYRRLLPASVRAPLYRIRDHVRAAFNLDFKPLGVSSADAPPLESAFAAQVEESASERYSLNDEGVPTAPSYVVPAIDSRPDQGIPERMMVGNPPREQLYL